MSTRPFRDDAHRDTALLKWLRREVNRDLRRWRSVRDQGSSVYPGQYTDLIADCKAKLALITWAEGWQKVRTSEYLQGHHVYARDTMLGYLDMVNAAVRRVAAGYSSRAGWRAEWEVR